MEELKALFEDGAIDYDTFEQKLAESGLKLANLSGGGYVDINKYAKLKQQFDEYKTQNDVSQYADYDDLKAEIEMLKAEKLEASQLHDLASAGVDEKFRKFVLAEVRPLVNENTDFKTALEGYLKENNQFVTAARAGGVFRMGSQLDLKGGAGVPKNTSEKMNRILRGESKQ